MLQTEIIGKEYDDALLRAVGATLRELGATASVEEWRVGGSQEITTWRSTVNGYPVTVEAETYVGISISGEAEIIDKIVPRVRAALLSDGIPLDKFRYNRHSIAVWISIKRGVLLSASLIFRHGGWIDRPSGECRLKQAGVNAAWVDLGKEGIHGNGNMMMLEKNSDAVAARIENWVDKALPERAASR